VSIKAVAEALLVPPVSLLLLAMAGLVIERRYRALGRLVTWTGLLLLLLLAMPAVSRGLLVALEQNLPLTPPTNAPPQAIVILGGDALRDRGPTGQPGLLSLQREMAGATLARRTNLPILVTGGPLHPGDQPIARLMADSLQRDFQVPVKWVEGQSRDTWENAHLSAPILRDQGIHSVYVVTQAWHMRRALLAFANTGIVATAAPTHFDYVLIPLAADFLPEVGAWREAFYAMHEWIGCAWYALR
jgi:uncharacterized SAM-binding protein YcdF (DUF218 family)